MGLSPPAFNYKVEAGVGGLQSIIVELDVFFMCLSMYSESSVFHMLLQFSFLKPFYAEVSRYFGVVLEKALKKSKLHLLSYITIKYHIYVN